MSNTSINLTNLDFNSLKSSFSQHLGSQTAFKDYDLAGSNLSVLTDLLAYNTYLNAFYLNMVASEMFLDTAQLRESVISHAKELNYLPRSFRSASATVNIAVTPAPTAQVSAVTIPRGTSFTSRVGSNTFTFTLNDNIVIAGSQNGVYTAANVVIYEGSLVTDTFVYDSTSTTQRFILSNPTVDTTSIRVYVTENNGSTTYDYNVANSYIGVTALSKAFFIQAAPQDLYEIVFGNGQQGRLPQHGAVISVVYRVGNGELPNGCAVFSSDDAIDGHTNVQITTVTGATGGSVHETTASIRKNAPRHYQTQERAVTSSDYRTLLQAAYPEIVAIHVFGGEEANPPRYGKVVISVGSGDENGIVDSRKTEYKAYLKERCPLTIDPIFIDPEYINAYVVSTVAYNIDTITVSELELLSAIKTQLRAFNDLNLNQFDTTLRYSHLITTIDASSPHIIGNSTDVIAYKEIIPDLNSTIPLQVDFKNALQPLNSAYIQPYVDNHAISSTYFVYKNGMSCKLEDDGKGVLRVVAATTTDGEYSFVENVGTVDYTTGLVDITSGLDVQTYDGNSIRVFAVVAGKDIAARQNDIIRIKDEDIIISVIGEHL